MAKEKKVAEILVEILAEAGVKHCYGIVGDTLNVVTDAIKRSPIQWIHMRHEESGALAAGAEAFISGNLTACAGSCGPGSLHFINGIYEANRNGAPVILIASQLSTTELGTDFPQEVNFLPIYKNCSVFCQSLDNPHKARKLFTNAVQTALNKGGVAVIILPTDIAQTTIEDQSLQPIWRPEPVLRPNDTELKKLARLIDSGKKIGIFAGIGCANAHDQVVQLAKLLKAPIAYTARVKDQMDYNNPYNVGMVGIFGTKGAYHMIENCDTLLLLGCGFAWPHFFPKKATIIQIDKDATRLGMRHPITLGLVGDIKPTIEELIPLLNTHTDQTFLDTSVNFYHKIKKKLKKNAVPEKGKSIHPQYLAHLINIYADDDALITSDGGTVMIWVFQHVNTNGKRRVLNSLKHGTMATAMPNALGLKKAYPHRQVVAVCGDGGITMLLGDLLTIIQEGLPVKLFVMSNCSLGFVDQEQKEAGYGSHFTDLENSDLATIANAMGIAATSVSNAQDLEAAVKANFSSPGSSLLNVFINREELIISPALSPDEIKNLEKATGQCLEHTGLT